MAACARLCGDGTRGWASGASSWLWTPRGHRKAPPNPPPPAPRPPAARRGAEKCLGPPLLPPGPGPQGPPLGEGRGGAAPRGQPQPPPPCSMSPTLIGGCARGQGRCGFTVPLVREPMWKRRDRQLGDRRAWSAQHLAACQSHRVPFPRRGDEPGQPRQGRSLGGFLGGQRALGPAHWVVPHGKSLKAGQSLLRLSPQRLTWCWHEAGAHCWFVDRLTD